MGLEILQMSININIVAAFQGMHVSHAKHNYVWLPRKCDYRTDRRRTKWSLYAAMLCRQHNKECMCRLRNSYAWLPRKCDYRKDRQTDRRRTKWSLCAAMLRRRHKKRLLLRCIHHFKSDLINNMTHMHFSGNETSSMFLKINFHNSLIPVCVMGNYW